MLIDIGLNNTMLQKQREQAQIEAELERYWSEFFKPGGQWSKLTWQFQLECIELWISAASFAYSAASVERRGLTPENLEQMFRDIEWAIDIAGWIFLIGGGIKKVGKEAAKKAARELKEELGEKVVKRTGKKAARKRAKRKIVDKTAREAVRRQIHRHHPLPKYLGGKLEQRLTKLPAGLHWDYHSALGEKLRVWHRREALELVKSKKKWVAEQMIEVTKKFDKEHHTNILRDLLFELKNHGWIK